MQNYSDDIYETKNEFPGRRMYMWGGFVVVLALVLTGVYFYRDAGFFAGNSSRIETEVDTPQNVYGQRVNAPAEVENVIGTRALTVGSGEREEDEILVISRQPLIPVGAAGPGIPLYQRDDSIRVVGEVQEFNREALQQELGVDLSEDLFVKWEGLPVVVADDIQMEY